MDNKLSITPQQVDQLDQAFIHFFPKLEDPNLIYAADKPWSTSNGEFYWENRKDFEDFIERLTQVHISESSLQSVKDANKKLHEMVSTTSAPEYTEETTTEEVRSPEQPAATTPDKISLEELQEAQVAEETRRAENAKSDEEVRKALKKKEELYKQLLKDKKVVVVPIEEIPVITLSDEEKSILKTFSEEAKTDPFTTQKVIEEKIRESLVNAPSTYQSVITQPIIKKTAKSITENFKALPDYKNITEFPNKIPTMHPASPIVAITLLNDAKLKGLITDDELRSKTVEMAQTVALGLEAETNVNFAGAEAVFGPQIASVFYGPQDGHLTQFEIAENQEEQKDEGIELDFQEIYDYGEKINDFWTKIKAGQTTVDEIATTTLTYTPTYTPAEAVTVAKTTTTLSKAIPTTVGAVYGFRQGAIAAQWARAGGRMLPGGQQSIVGLLSANIASGQTAATVSSSAFIMSKPIGFSVGNFSVGFVTGTQPVTGAQIAIGGFRVGSNGSMIVGLKEGTKIGLTQISSQVATKGTTAIVAKGGAQVAVKTLPLLSKVANIATKVLGIAGGWVGAILGFIGGEVLGKLLQKIDWGKIKKWISKNGPLLAIGLVGGGLLFRNLPMIAGGFGLGAATIATGGLRAVGTGIAGTWFTLKYLLRNIIAPSIFAPILITFLALPPLVALIMFIINSGAFIVPPTPYSGGGQFTSPYVDLTKKPNPSGPFGNSVLNSGQEVVYTISIKPKKGALNNVTLDYDCKVISKSTLGCPDITINEDEYKNIFTSGIGTISPTGITFTYTSTYDNKYSDSAIIDSITLSASTVDEPNVNSEVSASITFGIPPISCPVPGAKVATPLLNYSLNQSANTGHGSQRYWQAMGQSPSAYAIPQGSGCHSASDCSYYGFAYDVFPTGTREVFAPTVEGKDVIWQCYYGFSNKNSGHTYICTGSGYTLVLTHMANGAKTGTISSGTRLGTLFNQGSNTHLHIEFSINGRWQKPENYFCQ